MVTKTQTRYFERERRLQVRKDGELSFSESIRIEELVEEEKAGISAFGSLRLRVTALVRAAVAALLCKVVEMYR